MADQPLSPAGRLFSQPLTSQVIHCAIGFDFPIDVNAFKDEVRKSMMLKNPRFCSLMVGDHWRRTSVDVNRHIIVHCHNPTIAAATSDDAVNDFIADLSVSSPLPADKPLWEFHLLLAHNTIVFRGHHALGDGISLMSLLLSACRSADDSTRTPAVDGAAPPRRKWGLWVIMMVVWCTVVNLWELVLRAWWRKDTDTTLSGGDGVELWPRKLATARFRLDDMKIVKRAVAGATINDVLFGVISCGFSRYLDITSPKALPEGLRITGLAMTNLRPRTKQQDMSQLMNSNSGGQWGNKFGVLLLPVYYHGGCSDPIQFVKRAKAMIDKKKLSLEALFSYQIGALAMSLFGGKCTSIITYRLFCNTTFTVSNVVGPLEKITLARNPIKYLRVSSTSLPHAITMHMVSYAGVADLQILIAKDIIPDPKVLARCFEVTLLDMKKAVLAAN